MTRRHSRQRGSALLIVFVFAAMLAIMLYKEIPVATFEAEREKEQLLMDRGNEYKHAVKLYVRKFQTFPASLDALENTNRMRFLRHRYLDPFTGKDDWRLLHAGLGGTIVDSKIKTTLNAQPGQQQQTAASAGAVVDPVSLANPPGSAAANTFAQRGPAVSLNGAAGPADPSATIALPQQETPADPQVNSAQVPQASNIPYPGYPGPPNTGVPGQTDNPMANASGSYAPGAIGRFRNFNPTGNSFVPPGVAQQQQQQQQPQQTDQFGNPTDPQSIMRAISNNQNPPPTAQTGTVNAQSLGSGGGTSTFGSNPSNGTIQAGGGIAGVASKAPGRTIKVLNDQTTLALWEFVYDMRKELQANAPGQQGIGTGSPNGQAPGFNALPPQNNGFPNNSPVTNR